jgi:hypothetical protein
MVDRFNDSAKLAFRFALQASESIGIPDGISTKLLLIGIIRDNNSPAVKHLKKLGYETEMVLKQIELQAALSDEMPVPYGFTPEYLGVMNELWSGLSFGSTKAEIHKVTASVTKTIKEIDEAPVRKVLDYAYSEARRHGDELIGPEHLLIGLILEPTGLAKRVLEALGMTEQKLTASIYEDAG